MLAIGMSVFAEKFTPSNKTLEISLKEVLEGATPNGRNEGRQPQKTERTQE